MKLISLILIAAMLWQDMCWAHPGEFQHLRPVALGERMDGKSQFTHIPIGRAIWKIFLPAILDQVLFSALVILEMKIVGLLDVAAINCLIISRTIFGFAFTPIQGIVAATSSLVSQARGAQDKDGATKTTFNSLAASAVSSILFAVFFFIFAPWLLSAFGAEPETISLGVPYLRVFTLAYIGMSIVWILRSVFTNAGEVYKSFFIALATALASAALLLILPLGWGQISALGLEGTGWAQAAGRAAGVVLGFAFLLFVPSRFIKLSRENVKPSFTEIKKEIWGLGKYQFLQGAFEMGYGIFALFIISYFFGPKAIAAAGIIGTIWWLLAVPLVGLGAAVGTLVGINLGARKVERAEEAVKKASFYGRVIGWSLAAVLFTFAPEAIGFFTTDQEVIDIAAPLLRISTLTYSANMVSNILQNALIRGKDTKSPFIRSAIVIGGMVVFLLLATFVFHVSLTTLWVIMSLGAFAGLLVLKWRFKRGVWKNNSKPPTKRIRTILDTIFPGAELAQI